MVGSIETTFDERENEKKTKFIHPDKGMVEEWIRSLSESELEQYKKDSWNRTIYSALDSSIILQILLEIPTVKKYPKGD